MIDIVKNHPIVRIYIKTKPTKVHVELIIFLYIYIELTKIIEARYQKIKLFSIKHGNKFVT